MITVNTVETAKEILALAEEIRHTKQLPWADAIREAFAELPRLANDAQHDRRYQPKRKTPLGQQRYRPVQK